MFIPFFSPLNKGINLMRKGEYGLAADHFKLLIQKNKVLPYAYFNLGRCYFKLDRLDEAKFNLHKALDAQYSPDIVSGILEITNWKLLSSNHCFNSAPTFSDDGKKIAFLSARRCTNYDNKINALDNAGIFIVDTETGIEQNIVSDQYFNSQPKFSHDGKYLAYLSIRKMLPGKDTLDLKATPGLYILELATGIETLLVDEGFRVKHYVLSPSMEKIYFSGWGGREPNSGIYELDVKKTANTKEVVSGFYENTFPSLSKDGSKLVYASWRQDTNKDGVIDFRDYSCIYLKNLFTNTEKAIVSENVNSSFPSFSPDGQSIIYVSYRRDTNGDGVINSLDNPGIYIYNIEKEKEKCLVEDRCFNKFPSISPDGGYLVFLSSWRNTVKESSEKDFFEKKGVYVMELSSGKVSPLVSDKYYGSYFPIVSPVGNKVAYVSWRKDTNRGLYLADINNQPSKQELHSYIDKNI